MIAMEVLYQIPTLAELLESYNRDQIDVLLYLYDEIKSCDDDEVRKELKYNYNNLVRMINYKHKFKGYRLIQ